MTVYILYSETNSDNVRTKLGQSEYSYYFVREKFRAMLEKRATVIVVTDPESEVDAIYDSLRAQGLDCVFLAFCPPHRMPPKTRCPTVPVFAWEFDTIPDEIWDDDARNDWRSVLASAGQAITHSRYSADAVKSAMGPDFCVAAIPAPVWDDYCPAGGKPSTRALDAVAEIKFVGTIVDSDEPSTFADARQIAKSSPRRRSLADRLKLKKRVARLKRKLNKLVGWLSGQDLVSRPRHDAAVRLALRGTIFMSVFNPGDGRKNWSEMLTAFCCSLSDRPDATLVLKFVSAYCSAAMAEVRDTLVRFPAFKCRVIAIDAFLDDDQYRALLAASTFAVNSSLGEGQCLPLMEAMSSGKPVIAPRHTGMIDYVDSEVGFVTRSSLELCCWPHDPRGVFRARRYRGDWQSLVDAYRDAYTLANEQPESYQRMSETAVIRMRDFCSEQRIYEKLERFLRDSAVLSHATLERTSLAGRPLAAAARDESKIEATLKVARSGT